MFKSSFPTYQYYIEIKTDSNWETYLTFLYPNEETEEYIENQKVVVNLVKSVDNLTKPRLVDHWLYFKTEADRNSFLQYALQEKHKVEGPKRIGKALISTHPICPGLISFLFLLLSCYCEKGQGTEW